MVVALADWSCFSLFGAVGRFLTRFFSYWEGPKGFENLEGRTSLTAWME